MYLVEVSFELFADSQLSALEGAVMRVFDAWRHQGQVLGRELPTWVKDGALNVRVVCPEPDSLHARYLSPAGKHALSKLADAGLTQPRVKVLGRDLFSDTTAENPAPSWQLLYATFVHNCSPLRSGDSLAPIPLYRVPAIANGDHKLLLRWQDDWMACDQLQMNGVSAEQAALFELGDPKSPLGRRGHDFAKRIEYLTKIPTYYYLYRVGGESLEAEQNRLCPSCGQPWRLTEALHGIIDFKCDNCRLVSNLSWDFQ
ncbi:Zn-ribbon-containing protein [Gallaecimonas mangrovi]|uniref:Zn-ribbon-containing protein n=1 Tax=Gallaecimonas mangrovi TaxID=2291597 RepID=UPI000E20939E|nr:Zn-ribbon-containing protein [Gallaecimonas mangrovi]